MALASINYFLDTEFIACEKQRTLLGVPIGRPVPTVDLISLALVAEDGRQFYALNAECELAYAWADEWVREHVLRTVYEEHVPGPARASRPFTLGTLRHLFRAHGLRRAVLAFEALRFVYPGTGDDWPHVPEAYAKMPFAPPHPVFWGYYADYDWVIFCQLFGRMSALPHGFPMYCRDLKQERDRLDLPARLVPPDPARQHHALADAVWNVRLFRALNRYHASAERPRPAA